MANQSRTQQRSAVSRGRFGRPATSNRSSSGRSLRARPGEPGAKGRFGLGGALGPSSYGRSETGGKSKSKPKTRGRRSSQKSGVERALSALGGGSGGKAAKRASSRSAKPAGLALLAGAAGLALKNRDKLSGMLPGGGASRREAPGDTAYAEDTGALQSPAGGAGVSTVGPVDGHTPGGDVTGGSATDRANSNH